MNFTSSTSTSSSISTSSSLDEIGLQHGLDQSSQHHDYLKIYAKELSQYQNTISFVTIITAQDPIAFGNSFGSYFYNSKITVIALGDNKTATVSALGNVQIIYCSNYNAMHDAMMLGPRPDVLIEDGSNKKSQKLDIFKEFFLYLKENGKYVIEDLHASYIDSLNDVEGEDVLGLVARLIDQKRQTKAAMKKLSGDERELSLAIQSYTNYGKLAFVVKAGNHLIKLRDSQANLCLTERYGNEWGKNIFSKFPFEWELKNSPKTNDKRFDKRFKNPIPVPAMNVRIYNNVDCFARKVCVLGDFILPDSFRHGGARRLGSTGLIDATPIFASLPPVRKIRTLEGRYYYLDTEYPGHFGHIMTEVVSHLWAWKEALHLYPDLKALVSLPKNKKSIPTFQAEIFDAFGINRDRIEYIEYDEKVSVEFLIACTPQLSNPNWVHPEVVQIWDEIAQKVISESKVFPKNIFVSRPYADERSCNNTLEVEHFFSDHGFEIVYPETMTFSEQLSLFSGARKIAGFGGSGLFNMMFCANEGMRIVISGETYIAANEHLIAAATGAELHYFWCKSDKQYPVGRWTAEAFRSNFTFDFERDGHALSRLLKE
ncbi:glycosyltransferase 61 family protein [Specibacter sp. NPDC078692]|uniref:glycosyltransferase family 61 protein n=1 Tax=Specibacter sp. NPDC078692 TaxID=3155818 RepID=UPI0034434413